MHQVILNSTPCSTGFCTIGVVFDAAPNTWSPDLAKEERQHNKMILTRILTVEISRGQSYQAQCMHVTISLLHNNISLSFFTGAVIQTIKHRQTRQDPLPQPTLLGTCCLEWCHRQALQSQQLQQQVFARGCPDPDKESLQPIVDSQKSPAR